MAPTTVCLLVYCCVYMWWAARVTCIKNELVDIAGHCPLCSIRSVCASFCCPRCWVLVASARCVLLHYTASVPVGRVLCLSGLLVVSAAWCCCGRRQRSCLGLQGLRTRRVFSEGFVADCIHMYWTAVCNVCGVQCLPGAMSAEWTIKVGCYGWWSTAGAPEGWGGQVGTA